MTRYVINGRFLAERITGIQRYAYELTRALDRLVEGLDLAMYVPKNVRADLSVYRNIRLIESGKPSGILWEQVYFPHYLSKYKVHGINLCNVVPLFYPCGIACIHDISYRSNPQFFRGSIHARLSRIWHCLQYAVIAKKSTCVLTVSEFSRGEICRYYSVSPERVVVVPNAWQHFAEDVPDITLLLRRFPEIEPKNYLFSMCSVAPNKNLNWILEAAKHNPEFNFVVAGMSDPRRLGTSIDSNTLHNVVFLGYVSDNEAKALMAYSQAFVFPTLYEGFGVPPLEALSVGAKCLVSDIPVMHEVYGDDVAYLDPRDAAVDLHSLLSHVSKTTNNALTRFDWGRSAALLHEIIFEAEK